MVDGDPGAGRFPGEKARGGAQQIAGVHQNDAAVHVFHPLSGTSGSGVASNPPSLPDCQEVDGRNWIIGVAKVTRRDTYRPY
ncbi:hypothetical protein GCM10010272_03820 [Streptomyces lateritius]|nr:hypothetical protein GCM10010272_03820 [Streptomyces lateritius]